MPEGAKALISDDFDLYRSLLCLPMRFTTKDGNSYVLGDEQALRADFELYAIERGLCAET